MKQQSRGLAVITGASSGIGAVYADRLARRGYDLLLVARSQERMTDLAKKLVSETGSKVQVLAADLVDSNDLAKLEHILSDDSRVTLLVNNAGAGATAPLLNSDIAGMGRMIALNVEALTRLTYAVVPAFVKRGAGVIINIGSIVAIAPSVSMACMAARRLLCVVSANRCGMSWPTLESKSRSCCPERQPRISGTKRANRSNNCRGKS